MLLQGARRKNILYGSSTDEQRRSSLKDLQPCGLSSGGPLAALLLGHRALEAMLPRRALPAARQNSAHPCLFMRWVRVTIGLLLHQGHMTTLGMFFSGTQGATDNASAAAGVSPF